MSRLILTAEQTSRLASMVGPIEVVDQQSQHLGTLTLVSQAAEETHIFTREDMAAVKQRLESAHRDRAPAFKAEQMKSRNESQEK